MNKYTFNNAIGVLPRWLRQTLLVMKITTLILMISLLQVSAASFGQKVTIVKNNIALSEVFKVIRKQTGYNVLWQPAQVNGTKTISLNIKNQNLNEALDQILKGNGLELEIPAIVFSPFQTKVSTLIFPDSNRSFWMGYAPYPSRSIGVK